MLLKLCAGEPSGLVPRLLLPTLLFGLSWLGGRAIPEPIRTGVPPNLMLSQPSLFAISPVVLLRSRPLRRPGALFEGPGLLYVDVT